MSIFNAPAVLQSRIQNMTTIAEVSVSNEEPHCMISLSRISCNELHQANETARTVPRVRIVQGTYRVLISYQYCHRNSTQGIRSDCWCSTDVSFDSSSKPFACLQNLHLSGFGSNLSLDLSSPSETDVSTSELVGYRLSIGICGMGPLARVNESCYGDTRLASVSPS